MHKILLTALALATAAPAAHAAVVTSTFDTGADGWSFGAYQSPNTQAVDWKGSSQSIAKSHGFGGWGFIASSAYRGDQSAYVGGTFSFDLSATAVDVPYRNRPALIILGANGQTIFSKAGTLPGTNFTAFGIALDAASFRLGSIDQAGGAVSAAVFAAVMSNVRSIEILGDWTANYETVGLDNVRMASAPLGGVPEPGAWALMILGFGAAGARLRRRRAVMA
jgi:hypothetical protein